MNKNPLVSILIPTYNQPEFFRQAFESALNQTYKNIEIIVSDDSTDDRVKDVFDSYKNCGRIVKYLRHGVDYTTESVGERALLNMENLLEHAQGEFVNILFHDDLIYPQKISTMMQFLDEDIENKIAIVSSLRNLIDGSGNVIRTINTLNLNFHNDSARFLTGEETGRLMLLLCRNFVGELSTVLIRRKDFYRACVNKLSPGYFIGVKDRTMWDISTYLEACKDGRGLVFLREPLSAFRLSGKGQNTYNQSIKIKSGMDWIAFVAMAYISDDYLYSFEEFRISCESWLFHVIANLLNGIEPNMEFNNDDLAMLDIIIDAVESAIAKDFEITFHKAIEWILRYSAETTNVQRYITKNSRGLWCKRGD